MKKLLVGLSVLFICTFAIAHTINWHVGDTIIQTTTCDSGDSITPPTAPDKYGYTFVGWNVGYTQLEYIESTGTQYIDTGVDSANGYTINTNILFTSFSYSQVITGSYSRPGGGAEGDAARYFLRVDGGTGNLLYQYNSTTNYGSANLSLNTKYNIKCKLTKNRQYLELDGILKAETTISEAQAPVSLFFLATVGSSGAADNLCSARVYSCQYYDTNNVIVRNFIPVRRIADNVVGMYDTVSGQFFTNAGAGTFIAGPVVGVLNKE